jgi:hypothetical protein
MKTLMILGYDLSRIQTSKKSDVSTLGLVATESFPAFLKYCNYISEICNFGFED